MLPDPADILHLFVYGTLRPGDVRWPLLAPFVVGDRRPDSVAGALFDIGQDYPAAVFGDGDERDADGGGGSGWIVGDTFLLDRSQLDECLTILDAEEDTVGGRYRRVTVTTESGVTAWAYAYGTGLELAPIPHGDWFVHRPPAADA